MVPKNKHSQVAYLPEMHCNLVALFLCNYLCLCIFGTKKKTCFVFAFNPTRPLVFLSNWVSMATQHDIWKEKGHLDPNRIRQVIDNSTNSMGNKVTFCFCKCRPIQSPADMISGKSICPHLHVTPQVTNDRLKPRWCWALFFHWRTSRTILSLSHWGTSACELPRLRQMQGQLYISKYHGYHGRLGPHKKPREDLYKRNLRPDETRPERQYGGCLEYTVDSLAKVWVVCLERHILANLVQDLWQAHCFSGKSWSRLHPRFLHTSFRSIDAIATEPNCVLYHPTNCTNCLFGFFLSFPERLMKRRVGWKRWQTRWEGAGGQTRTGRAQSKSGVGAV